MLGLGCCLRCSIVMLHCNNVVPCSLEVAGVVFNRCVKENDRRFDDPDYEITLDYEFLEDIYSDWSENGDGAASETSNQMNFYKDGIPKKDEYKGCCGKPGAEEAVQQLERKENHPLMIMVSPPFYFLFINFFRKFHRLQ